MVISGASAVSPFGIGGVNQLRLFNSKNKDLLAILSTKIRKNNSIGIIQISHAGSRANANLIKSSPKSASSYNLTQIPGFISPQELSIDVFNLGNFVSIGIASAVGIFIGVLVAKDLSGAHLNPAITFALAIANKFSIKKTILYIAAQMVGGFIGSAIVYIFYFAKFNQVDPALEIGHRIFSTFSIIS
jgi:glycerol uptake facilitator-like aquaporin